MWERILVMFIDVIDFSFNTFTLLMHSIDGAWSTIFTLIIITLIFRFILAPLFSSGSGSDTAKKKKEVDS